jgi:deoxyribonucleoside regulator
MPENLQGNSSETRLLSDERFLRKTAYLYYEEGHSQEAIAEMEFCSRQSISKALQKARDRGIVRISIIPDLRMGYLRNLSREVRVQLGLEDLILVASQDVNSIKTRNQPDEVVTEIANAAADYLDQVLTDSDILAVSGGRSFMRTLVQYLKPTKVLPHLQVVSTIGFVEARTSFGDANLIAHDLAEIYGANHSWFPCPAFLPNREQLQFTRQLPIIREAYEMMKRANIIVTSLWTPHSNENMIIRNILSQKQVETIKAYHPAMDINHWVFDASGKCLNETVEAFPYTLSGLEIPRLKDAIQNHNAKVILLAGGTSAYVPAIQAALKAGLVNILVTDHITAQMLLND